MVDIKGKLNENKKIIIMVGLVIGGLDIVDFLPSELPVVTTYTKFVYMGIVGLAAYLFYTNYWHSRAPTFARKVNPRNLSSPTFQKDLKRQMGGYEQPPQRSPQRPLQAVPGGPPSPSKDVFDKFNRPE